MGLGTEQPAEKGTRYAEWVGPHKRMHMQEQAGLIAIDVRGSGGCVPLCISWQLAKTAPA